MVSENVFVGKAGTYTLPDTLTLPAAVGRASIVYRGEAANGSPVCIKVYKDLNVVPGPIPSGQPDRVLVPRGTSNFDHELRAYAQLEHPNILPVLDFGHERDT